MCRVLWVEDEPATLSGYRRALSAELTRQSNQVEWVTVQTREDAWKALAARDTGGDPWQAIPYDAIVLDVMLPNTADDALAGVVNRAAGAQLLARYARDLPNSTRPRTVVFTALVNGEVKALLQGQLREGLDLYVEKVASETVFVERVAPLIMASLTEPMDRGQLDG